MEKRRTLLEKYGIPINHLDFDYIEKCKNAREMEKILHILRSGEEGYYPDLTRCAEEKLKELKPDSRLFRFEERVRKSEELDKQELKPIYDWNQKIKQKDKAFAELKTDVQSLAAELPPMRKPSKIDMEKSKENKSSTESNTTAAAPKPSTNRIKSTDYSKWDKYDPDVEMLRMDLDDERTKEQKQLKDRLNTEHSHIKICEIGAEEVRMMAQLKNLTPIEREEYAEKYRLKGNEYFRAKEYDFAIAEYGRAITYDPPNAARAYNNRALSHIKLKECDAAIKDLEQCLKLEPDNIKALLRLAEVSSTQGRQREACDLYRKVLELEPNNAAAEASLKQLHNQLGELAPNHATRLTIEEHKSDAENSKPKLRKPAPIPKEYDLAELVKPDRIVKSKLVNAAEAIGKLKAKAGGQTVPAQQLPKKPMMPMMEQPMLRLSENPTPKNNKMLIQEI